MLRHAIGAAVLALAFASADPAAAQRIKAGLLTCDVSGGIGLIIASQKQVSCVYAPDLPGPQEAYVGSFSRFGLDIGVTGGGVMVWAVFTDTTRGPGFLAGDYVGASGEVSFVAGLGANVLVGGSNRTVALQPLSVSGDVGVNLALGIGDLSLRPAGR
jgi:Protein of unknown function (DUF992)